jgi:hypothetical protein
MLSLSTLLSVKKKRHTFAQQNYYEDENKDYGTQQRIIKNRWGL